MVFKGLAKTTKYWRGYWKKRKIDWNQAYMNPDHPHRQIFIEKLKNFGAFRSVLEVGCAAGANLYKIKTAFPESDIGGIDWSADAIEEAKRLLPKASVLQVGEATDIYISSKGADIIISDMCYIYLTPGLFKKALIEAKRVARVGVIFCEFHSSSWFKRTALKIASGYNAHDYKKSMTEIGFHDIELYKLTEADWPGGEPQKSFGYVVSART